MSMSKAIAGPRRVKVWQADAEWPDDAYVVPAEDYDLTEVDRDIKAANLQLLVEKVLYMDAAGERFEQNTNATVEGTLGDEWQRASEELVDLARSLKQ